MGYGTHNNRAWEEGNMKCPKCRKNIDRVVVISKCWQYGDIDDSKTNLVKPKFRISDYGSVEEIFETIGIACPECDTDLSAYVEE